MKTVIKVGGSILSGKDKQDFDRELDLEESGKTVLVHGGGPAVTELCSALGIEPKFVTSPGGIRSRLTDYQTIQAYIMAMNGRINTELVMRLIRMGLPALGLSGIDGHLLTAERKERLMVINEKGRKMFIDGGYTGRITRVNSSLLDTLLDAHYIPVVSPLAISTNNEPLNVDGDRAASAIAGAISADRLLLLTNVDGVLLKDSLVREATLSDLPDLMSAVGHGMDKKLLAAREALESGTKEVIIANGKSSSPIHEALFSQKRTVITKC